MKLLDFAAQHPGLFPSITICLLRQAILAGHHHILELLLDEHPGLLETAKLTPWLLYEAAAASDNTSHVDGMVCALARRGLDITATDELGRGSMLAAASRELNTACIHRLLGAKVPTNSIAAGMKESGGCHQSWWYNYEYRLKGIMGKSALHIAIERGFETLVDLLLHNGADPNQFCDSFPIHLAAWKGNSNIVTSLVKAGANVHNTSHKHKAPIELEQIGTSLLTFPPIVTALMRGYMDVAEILFDAGGDPLHGVPRQWRSKFQGSFFQVVIKKGSPRLIHNTVKIWKWDAGMAIDCISTSLVRFGQDFADEIQTLNPSVSNHIAIICASITSGYLDSAESLVRERLAIDGTISPHLGARALILAVRNNASDLVRLFIQAGLCPFLPLGKTADPQLRNLDSRHELRTGESAFQASAKHGRNSMVELFLHNRRHEDPVEKFIQRQQLRETYISALCNNWNWPKRLLSELGVDMHDIEDDLDADSFGKQIHDNIIRNIEGLRYDEVDRLLELAAHHNVPASSWNATPRPRVNSLNPAPEKHTALQLLAQQNETSRVKKLLDLGADANARAIDEQGATALQFAASNGNFDIVNMLLTAGADVNAAPAAYDGRTAIEGAAEWGRLDMVRYLLDNGADIRGSDNPNH